MLLTDFVRNLKFEFQNAFVIDDDSRMVWTVNNGRVTCCNHTAFVSKLVGENYGR